MKAHRLRAGDPDAMRIFLRDLAIIVAGAVGIIVLLRVLVGVLAG
jgi:hypothetical protein